MATIDARITRSRRALLDAAIELLLINPQTSLQEIAKHAGVGRATLYRQFENREQLIQALAIESCDAIECALAPLRLEAMTAVEAIGAIVRHSMPLADRFHFLLNTWHIAEQDPQVMAICQQQEDGVAALVEQAKSDGKINPALDTGWVVKSIDNQIYTGWWMMQQGKMTAEQAADQAIASLFGGIGMTGNAGLQTPAGC